MAKILRKEEKKKPKVITIKGGPSDSIQTYKLLPKCMIPKKKRYEKTPG